MQSYVLFPKKCQVKMKKCDCFEYSIILNIFLLYVISYFLLFSISQAPEVQEDTYSDNTT